MVLKPNIKKNIGIKYEQRPRKVYAVPAKKDPKDPKKLSIVSFLVKFPK